MKKLLLMLGIMTLVPVFESQAEVVYIRNKNSSSLAKQRSIDHHDTKREEV